MDGPRPRSVYIVFLFISFFLAACGAQKKDKDNGGIKRWSTMPVVIYADSSIVSSAADQADFADAMGFWEERAGRKIFDYQGIWGGGAPFAGDPGNPSAVHANVVMALNPWSLAQNIAGLTTVFSVGSRITSSMVIMNPNLLYCSGACIGQSGVSKRKVLAHELGHFLGISHSPDKNNLMYAESLPGGNLNSLSVDQNLLLQLVNP